MMRPTVSLITTKLWQKVCKFLQPLQQTDGKTYLSKRICNFIMYPIYGVPMQLGGDMYDLSAGTFLVVKAFKMMLAR